MFNAKRAVELSEIATKDLRDELALKMKNRTRVLLLEIESAAKNGRRGIAVRETHSVDTKTFKELGFEIKLQEYEDMDMLYICW